jgi:hypothetical protein
MLNRQYIFLVLVLFVTSCDASNTSNPPSSADRSGSSLASSDSFSKLAPAGWILQKSRIVDVDINGDGAKDAILTLIEDKQLQKGDISNQHVEECALLVLLGDKDGHYHRSSLAKNVLLCVSCAGMMGTIGDAEPGEILYENKMLTISWIAGSRDTVEVILNFRFDGTSQQFVLSDDKVEKTDRNVGGGTVVIRDFVAGTRTVDGKVSTMEKKATPMDSVKYYDYLGYQ